MTVLPGDKFKGDKGTALITVIHYDKHHRQVIFKRSNYPHECMLPLSEFNKKFTDKLN